MSCRLTVPSFLDYLVRRPYRHRKRLGDGFLWLLSLGNISRISSSTFPGMPDGVLKEVLLLTDAALKSLKSRDKPYKLADRDGMYAHISPFGTVTFRLDYRINGRRETVNFGRYGRDGISLVSAGAASCAKREAACFECRMVISSKSSTPQRLRFWHTARR